MAFEYIGKTYDCLTIRSVVSCGVCTCDCSCGRRGLIRYTSNVTSGRTRSCGCATSALLSSAIATHGDARVGAVTAERVIWGSMRQRCMNPRSRAYPDYGGRGISIHPRWTDYATFLSDMGRRPTALHTLERIDNSGNYEPGNVRWATRAEQNRNTRKTRKLTAFGKTMPLWAWVEASGMKYRTLWSRLRRGASLEEALSTPPKRNNTNAA